MSVTVRPEQFAFVQFDAGKIAELVSEVAERVGFAPGTPVVVEVNESSPFGVVELRGLDPIELYVESGALEDPQRLRHFSRPGAADSFGRLLLQAWDRFDPDFSPPTMSATEIPLPHRISWDVYCHGRLAALGYRDQRQRRLYSFRTTHGFSDHGDEAFRRLWEGKGLTWSEIVAISDGARGSDRPTVDPRS